jgi:hypothetical protein
VNSRTWKRWAAWIITGLIIISAATPGPASRSAAAESAAAADTPHTLTPALKAGVKTVLNERVPEGVRIGAVVRLYNTDSRAVAVPGYELRAVTTGGVVYTLKPSDGNPRIVQPREMVELSYMLTVGRADAFALQRLAWVNVDEYVYPKKETNVLNMPVTDQEWYGPSTVFTDARRLKDWGAPFTIPTESGELVYTPVRLAERHTPQGTTAVLVLQVKNTGSRQAWVPEFTVTGKTGQEYYPAERAESGPIAVQPGASRYLHFVMRLDAPQAWKSFTISTPESFTGATGTIRYEVGRLQFKPPVRQETQAVQTTYNLLDPISVSSTFRPNLAKEVDIALAEVRRFEQSGDNFLTAVAKFRLVNRSGISVAVPDFGVEWTTSEGVSYTGERLDVRQKMLMPDVGMLVTYIFTLPLSAGTEDQVRFTLLDGKPDSFQLPVGAVKVSLKAANDDAGGAADMYPFKVDIRSASVDSSGLLALDIGISRAANVTFDERSVRLKLEAVDSEGRMLASRTYALAGADRLASGIQTIDIGDRGQKSADGEVVIRLYEVFAAPGGDVERLVQTKRVSSS